VSTYSVHDQDYQPRGPELHFYRCNRVCKSLTAKSIYTGTYERCRGCESQALYVWSIPVVTDTEKAIHAQGVVLNPYNGAAPRQVCVRCGLDYTGKQLPRYRADGKVCRDCYFAEDAPEVVAAQTEQSINQSTESK
jgi:hypothetical protein